MSETPWKPTRAQLDAACNGTVPDVLTPGLRVVFCGINPGLYTAAVKHHFARPGNRFWPALFRSGFTPRLLSPFEEDELPGLGCGITNLVSRATATAAELLPEELTWGAAELGEKLARFRPQAVAFLGITAYRTAFQRPEAKLGKQDERWEGAEVWVLPNPSGLNAHFRLDDLAACFARLRAGLVPA